MASYRDRIEAAVRPLLAKGFKVTRVREDPESFGDTELVLASPDMRLRFISDRGQMFADVGPPKGRDWYELCDVLLDAGLIRQNAPWDTPEAAVSAIEAHTKTVIDCLRKREFLAGLPKRR